MVNSILVSKAKIRAKWKLLQQKSYLNLELYYIYAEFVGNILGDISMSHDLKLDCLHLIASAGGHQSREQSSDLMRCMESHALLVVSADPVPPVSPSRKPSA